MLPVYSQDQEPAADQISRPAQPGGLWPVFCFFFYVTSDILVPRSYGVYPIIVSVISDNQCVGDKLNFTFGVLGEITRVKFFELL